MKKMSENEKIAKYYEDKAEKENYDTNYLLMVGFIIVLVIVLIIVIALDI